MFYLNYIPYFSICQVKFYFFTDTIYTNRLPEKN